MKRTLHGFRIGFLSPLKGLSLAAKNPRIRKLMVIPFFISCAVFIIGSITGLTILASYFLAALTEVQSWIGLEPGSTSYYFVYWVTLLLAIPASLFALFYFLFLAARLIATPFYALLAERVLIETGLLQDRPFQAGEWAKTNAHLLGVAFVKLAVFVVVGLLLFVLSFIPGLAVLTAFGFLLMAAFDVVDLSFEALRMGFRERFTVFRAEFPAFVGLALMLGLVFLIPGLNFFLFPAAIAGGSEIVRIWRLR